MVDSPIYNPLRHIAVVVFYVLELWNQEDSASTAFIACTIVEGAIICLLLFNAISTIIIRRYERWVLKELQNYSTRDTITSQEANTALFSLTSYGEPLGIYVALLFCLFCQATFFVKLAGNFSWLSFSRWQLLQQLHLNSGMYMDAVQGFVASRV